MSVRAILFDVGGPIDLEVRSERLIDDHIVAALDAAGIAVSGHEYAAAAQWAVDSFAPNAYQAIIWRLCRSNQATARRAWLLVERRAEERDRLRGGVELRPGIAELMSDLAQTGIGLGLAANQPARAVGALDRLGVGQFLGHREVSGTNALRKPDVRVFLQACAALEVKPEDTMLIGDRIDIDIAPAKSLGMTTVRFLWGRHMSQTPRSWSEVPDVEVSDTQGLRHALGSLGLV